MSKNSLKGSLGSGLGEVKKLEKQNIEIPVIADAVKEIHKRDLLNLRGKVQFENQDKETKGIFIKINKELHKSIKKHCVLNEIDMQEYFTEAIIIKAKADMIVGK